MKSGIKREIDLDTIADSESAKNNSCRYIQRRVERAVARAKRENLCASEGEVTRDRYEQIRYDEDQSMPGVF